ncbi:MAG: hypothetical protein MJD61_16395 [Proteobacteria bacterium]|nr:hypothetical protein [Pseudomonadota bacterium]
MCIPARAQAHARPPHWIFTGSLGTSLRVARHAYLGQGWLAPWFTGARLSYAVLQTGTVLHGPSLGAEFNLSADGGFSEPLEPASQLALTPGYCAYVESSRRTLVLTHAGVTWLAAGPSRAFGLTASLLLAYRVRAGIAVFSQGGLGLFGGAGSSLHPLLSLELGALLDYEVLP